MSDVTEVKPLAVVIPLYPDGVPDYNVAVAPGESIECSFCRHMKPKKKCIAVGEAKKDSAVICFDCVAMANEKLKG